MSTLSKVKLKKASPSKQSKSVGSYEVFQIQKAAKKASTTAVRISKALELPIQFIEKGKLIEVKGNGEKRVIKEIHRVASKIPLKKGDKIWLKPIS
jgi:hypothetical protein